jgi:O-antigen/teichoic acid export membrane protein
MSRTRKFFGGLMLSYAYQGLLVVTGLWLTPFMLRHIGQHDYGLWLVGTQLLAYLTLTDFGVVALLPLETAYATGRGGGVETASDLPFIVGRTVRLVFYQLPIVMAIAAVMWFTIPAEWHALRGPLAVVLIGFVIAFPLRILHALLQGLQDLAFLGWLQMVGWTVTTAMTIFMVLQGWSLMALAVGWLLLQVLPTPISFYRLVKHFPTVLPRSLPPMVWKATLPLLGRGFWISVAQIAQALMSNTDLLIIGRLLGPAAVVPYSCTGKLANVLSNQAQILMQVATPGLCELKTGGSRQQLLSVLVAMTRGVLTFSGLVFCIVLLVNHWFVDWWVTGRQYGGFALTAGILFNVVVRHWTTTTSYSVFCFGYQRRISLTNLVDGLVTVCSCVGLTMLLGPVGAPLGSSAGACLISLPCNLWMMAKETDVSLAQLANMMLRGWAWRFALVAAATVAVATRWSPKNLPEAVVAVVSVTIVYVLVMLPNVLRPPLGNYITPVLASFRGKYAALQMRISA